MPSSSSSSSSDHDPGKLLDSGLPHLLDDRSRPDFRTVYGTLARRAGALDAAVARIRLSGLNLRPDELRGVQRLRVLLSDVSGLTLRAEAEAVLLDPIKAGNLRHLVGLMDEGRIQVRSAPLGGWIPDFSVFHRNGRPWTVLVGLHWFARPFPHRGPALASLHGATAAGRAASRFTELWRSAHDVSPAILGLLHEAERRTVTRLLPAPTGLPRRAGRRGHGPLPEPRVAQGRAGDQSASSPS